MLNGALETSEIEKEDITTLVKKVKRGDQNAFQEMRKMYEIRIYNKIKNVLQGYGIVNEHDTEDIAQDVWIKVWENIGNFKEESSFYTWAYAIATHVSINFGKSKKHNMLRRADSLSDTGDTIGEGLLPEILISEDTPSTLHERWDMIYIIRILIPKLSPEHQEVIGDYMNGIPHETTAKRLGVSAGTIRSRFYYARQELRGLLDQRDS